MMELCALTNLTSSEWAAWVQAVGSVVAILAALGIMLWQQKIENRRRAAMRDESYCGALLLVAEALTIAEIAVEPESIAPGRAPQIETEDWTGVRDDLGEIQIHALPYPWALARMRQFRRSFTQLGLLLGAFADQDSTHTTEESRVVQAAQLLKSLRDTYRSIEEMALLDEDLTRGTLADIARRYRPRGAGGVTDAARPHTN